MGSGWIRLACLAVACFALASFGLGCNFVFDELDKAEAELARHRPGGGEAATSQQSEAEEGTSPFALARERSAAWWESARSLGSTPSEASIISCKVDGRVLFMRRNDCVTRGGRAG